MKSGQPLKGVIFDWAGTLVDFGSLAPVQGFVRLFEEQGIGVTVEQARMPMGLPKRDHIVALATLPGVAEQWHERFGRAFTESDADRLLAIFEPMSARAALDRSQLIPGVLDCLAVLRADGLLIGSTTGYTRSIMHGVLASAAHQGFTPDTIVCTDEVPQGRPSPLAIYRCMLDLCLWPASALVKVDDTAPGLAEGTAAGCWTVGVLASGNAVGLDIDAYHALTAPQRTAALAAARIALDGAGAHELVESVADLPSALERIRVRIDAGETPWAR